MTPKKIEFIVDQEHFPTLYMIYWNNPDALKNIAVDMLNKLNLPLNEQNLHSVLVNLEIDFSTNS